IWGPDLPRRSRLRPPPTPATGRTPASGLGETLLAQRTVISGKYRLERPLARGGMGSVWVARHLALDVDVAVERMAPGQASSVEARERFERERNLLRQSAQATS